MVARSSPLGLLSIKNPSEGDTYPVQRYLSRPADLCINYSKAGSIHHATPQMESQPPFIPPNPALLGLIVNGGQEVKPRLRRQNNGWDFFPFEQILDIMLHELCHNQFGPHNADFYKLLDEIRKDLIFVGKDWVDIPVNYLCHHCDRSNALSAAENRVQRGTLLPSGAKRLSGDSSMRDVLSPFQAVTMAAERRLHVVLSHISRNGQSQNIN
ncbi:DNA-dependent metalloprotease WSS1-like protein [Tanacetum coccineum]